MKSKRKVKATDRKKALQQEQITYENIQQKAFDIKEGIDKFFGILKPCKDIIENEELFYVD